MAGVDLLLYDGVCGLCHGLVRFLLARDRRHRLRFAALQSTLATEILARHGRDAALLDTVYLIRDYGGAGERVFARGRGAVIAIGSLGRGWALFHAFRLLPNLLLDLGYGLVARRRYRLFGRLPACALPSPADRERFLDADEIAPR